MQRNLTVYKHFAIIDQFLRKLKSQKKGKKTDNIFLDSNDIENWTIYNQRPFVKHMKIGRSVKSVPVLLRRRKVKKKQKIQTNSITSLLR